VGYRTLAATLKRLAETDCPRYNFTVRNREAPLRIVVVADAERLAGRIRPEERCAERPS
jgi:hypothetical protein